MAIAARVANGLTDSMQDSDDIPEFDLRGHAGSQDLVSNAFRALVAPITGHRVLDHMHAQYLWDEKYVGVDRINAGRRILGFASALRKQ